MKITVLNGNSELNIKSFQEQNLLAVLQDNNIFVSNLCNGNGTCGKCKIKVISGNLPITETDRRILSEEELERGIRLACKIKIDKEFGYNSDDEIVLEVLENMEDDIVVENVPFLKSNEETEGVEEGNENRDAVGKNYFIAIDIGTTTIAMALVDYTTGKVCDTYASVNHQRKFGADVISRIVAANEGKSRELKQIIEEDLWSGIYYFMDKIGGFKVDKLESIEKDATEGSKQEVINNLVSGIVVAGNTTMIHLLMGYSCEHLGKYPFISDYLEEAEHKLRDCIGIGQQKCANWMYDIPVLLMPGISAFVGGDIVAGLCACPGFQGKELSLFLDLGTNGEMVLGNKDRMLATSVAAGPAFEGGNISCGTASIPGSISRAKIYNKKSIIGTIDKKMPPIGICGSGLISVVAQLLQGKIIDFHGNLLHLFRKEGFPLWTFSDGHKLVLSQEDIRQFQMAKSAVRSGIEILMQEYGCQTEDVREVYLAGGFGTNLLEEDVITSGILPQEWRGNIRFLGNTALQGAVKVGNDKFRNTGNKHIRDAKQADILKKVSSITLADKKEFQEIYMNNLDFL